MTCSQPQFQHVLSNACFKFDRFGAGSARFFLSLGLPGLSGLDLQQSSEEGTPSENAKDASIPKIGPQIRTY
jgi:hypothetical protein